MKKFTLMVCLCLVCLVPRVHAVELESYWPVATGSEVIDGQLYVGGVFLTTDGGLYCGCDTLTNVSAQLLPYWPVTPDKAQQIGPDLVANAKPLPPPCIPMCEDMGWVNPNPEQWTVAQYLDSPDRPVKRILADGTIDKGDTIGRITWGAPCGDVTLEASRGDDEWREVTITYDNGEQVTGAAVCEKSSQ